MTAQAVAARSGDGDRTDQVQHDFASRGLPFWLPPGGRGNGIPAEAWTMLVELDEADSTRAVAALSAARIAVYVSPVRAHDRIARCGRRVHQRRRQMPPRWVVWVDPLHRAAAEGVLMSVLARPGNARSDNPLPGR